ncbi:basic salivary proline-rich protein 2-like [Eupeodes corollae]|uniref:basic salivary proline-rich protein 2-like n=1 Tax=Eupeodes corollae TaxID=290404 RepID=UPI002492F28F|nr:basic salivary proline-rich protein 2-like [Eupeodes corollae]
MFVFKYVMLALTLVIWFTGASSVDYDYEDMQGDREKRTLVLGVLFKKLLLQQALARNNMRMMNTTTMMPPPEMMGASNSSPSPAPPPPPPSPPQSPPQPPQAPESTSQEPPPPAVSMPQGIRNPQAVPQGPAPSHGFPQQQQGPPTQGFPSLNVFHPSQQQLLFPPNYPFGVQRFRQLPFGPAPPLGAQAGPQRIPNYVPFTFQNGYFQNIAPRPSFQQLIGTPGSPPQSASQVATEAAPVPQNSQPAPPQQIPSDNGPPQDQTPPEQAPPSAPGPSGPGGPTQETQPSPSSQDVQPGQTGPTSPELQSPTGPGSDTTQGSPPNPPPGAAEQQATNPPEPQQPQLPAGEGNVPQQQNFQFGGGSLPNFSFGPRQGTDPSNGQEAQAPPSPPAQQGPDANFSPQPQSLDNNFQQQFDPQLQLQLSSNGLSPADPNNNPQNFASSNGSPQSGQPDNSFFDLRQFAGADNSVFDFPQEGGTPSNGNPQQQQPQQQIQSESFQNGLFAPSGAGQFSSVNDPRTNFAFRGQQLDFSSPFQDSGNFQRNFFQQNLF